MSVITFLVSAALFYFLQLVPFYRKFDALRYQKKGGYVFVRESNRAILRICSWFLRVCPCGLDSSSSDSRREFCLNGYCSNDPGAIICKNQHQLDDRVHRVFTSFHGLLPRTWPVCDAFSVVNSPSISRQTTWQDARSQSV